MYLQKSQRSNIPEGSLGDISDVIAGQVTVVTKGIIHEWFEPRSHIITKSSMIVRVSIVLF